VEVTQSKKGGPTGIDWVWGGSPEKKRTGNGGKGKEKFSAPLVLKDVREKKK